MSLVDRKLYLKPRLHKFTATAFGSTTDLMRPIDPRERDTLIVACSEMGTAPDNISFQTPNRCVVLQHLAASMPSRDECETNDELSIDAVIEQFVKYDFRHVVVCGHTHCGVIRSWLEPAKKPYDDVGSFRARFELGTKRLVDQNYPRRSSEQRFKLMVFEHVLCQIENLLTHPFFATRVNQRELLMHGWVIDDATARVMSYCPKDSAFSPA